MNEDIIPDGEAPCSTCGGKHSYFPCDKKGFINTDDLEFQGQDKDELESMIKMLGVNPADKIKELEDEVYRLKTKVGEMDNVEIPSEVIDFINDTPEFNSFLYDMDMLPEQCLSDGAKMGLRGCYLLYVTMTKMKKKVEKELSEKKDLLTWHHPFWRTHSIERAQREISFCNNYFEKTQCGKRAIKILCGDNGWKRVCGGCLGLHHVDDYLIYDIEEQEE